MFVETFLRSLVYGSNRSYFRVLSDHCVTWMVSSSSEQINKENENSDLYNNVHLRLRMTNDRILVQFSLS